MLRHMQVERLGKVIRALLPVIIWLLLVSPLRADIIYMVEEGDSAWSIAIHFGVSLDDLYTANGWASDENPVLQIGQRIAIPGESDDESADSEVADDEEEIEPADETTCIVQPGDNPYIIAHRFGLGTLTLLEYNQLTEDDLIHPGQLLNIPPDDYEYQGNAESEEEPEEEAEPVSEPIRYIVQAGDSPWVIARRFSISTQTLLIYNNLDSSAILHVGDELLIPVDGERSLTSRSGIWRSYVVQVGDTLSEIANDNGVSLIELTEANNLAANSIIREGQQIEVPSNSTQSAEPTAEVETPQTPTLTPPPPPEDLSDVLEPLPSINDGNYPNTDEDAPGWHSEIFDFTQISSPEPSTPDPDSVSDGGLSSDGSFDDGTSYHLYTVRRGDTISEVAHAFDITQSELINRNDLDIRTSLRIGRDLKIPLPQTIIPSPGSDGSPSALGYGAPDTSIGDGSGGDLALSVVEEATSHLGTPYVWSGTSLTGGVDCSGFTMSVYAQFDVSLPHRSRDQAECGVAVEYSDLLPGDLIFFHTTRSGISHVGLYIGNGDFVHSSSHRGGVIISPLDTGYYNQRFVCARRVL